MSEVTGHGREGSNGPVLLPLTSRFRRTGADLPGGDPRPSHGAEMEGYFWRFTDPAAGRVVVALCGVNRHPDGDWATVAVAAHPGGFVRAAELPDASAAADCFYVRAGNVDGGDGFEATERSIRMRLGDDVRVDMRLDDTVGWPLAFGGGGVFSAVPFLNQYWHPHVLGGVASGTAVVGDDPWLLGCTIPYAEKNWGRGFPERWWWGQAQAFEGGDAGRVCVAFSGGVLSLGPLSVTVGGVVVRVDDEVIRLTPPTAVVRSSVDVAGDRWQVEARGRRHRVSIVGWGVVAPHVLPVPLPAERRNVDTDFEHLAGRLHLRVETEGRLLFEGRSELAGLEHGSRPA